MNHNFPEITISAINCNSLNLASRGQFNQKLKIYGICKLRTDVILLSDVRMSNRHGVTDSKYVKESFGINPYCSYNIINNSSKNKRGVAILIKNSVPFTVEDARADPDENFLACRLQIKGCTIILVSVYGPNGNDLQFFSNLRENISSLGDHPIVAGGDWNCLWSRANLGLNIDAVNMVAIPNAANSKKLREVSEMLDITDPYRVLHPGRRDYSYVPRQVGRTNKSRLDFFLLSKSVIDKIVECNIVPHLQNKLFDHKAILLSFVKKRKTQKNLRIEQATTKEEELDIIVNLAAYETYLRHSELDNVNRGELMAMLARNKRKHREAGLPYGHRTPGDMDELQVMVRAGIITDIRDELAAFPFNDLINGP
jgi:exonuclease III